MKTGGKKDIITVINKSAKELHNKIDMHYQLMNTLVEKEVGDEAANQFILPAVFSDEGKLKEALKETIEVLEESRKAFKSKRLELLRKKLTKVLIASK